MLVRVRLAGCVWRRPASVVGAVSSHVGRQSRGDPSGSAWEARSRLSSAGAGWGWATLNGSGWNSLAGA